MATPGGVNTMSTILYRWGKASARHPWRMIVAWLVVAVAVVGLQSTVGGETSDDWSIPGTEAQRRSTARAALPDRGRRRRAESCSPNPTATSTDAAARAAIEATLAAFASGPQRDRRDRPVRPAQPASAPTGPSPTPPCVTASTHRPPRGRGRARSGRDRPRRGARRRALPLDRPPATRPKATRRSA